MKEDEQFYQHEEDDDTPFVLSERGSDLARFYELAYQIGDHWLSAYTHLKRALSLLRAAEVAFTPKGGCPLKRTAVDWFKSSKMRNVAFTPKGGCPLKPTCRASGGTHARSSIHPQGWVPIETRTP